MTFMQCAIVRSIVRHAIANAIHGLVLYRSARGRSAAVIN